MPNPTETTPPAAGATPPAATPPAAPPAPAGTTPPAPTQPAAGRLYTQEEVNGLIRDRLARGGSGDDTAQQLTEIRAQLARAEQAAVTAIVARAAAAAHDPAAVARLVDLGGMTSEKAAEIEAKVTAYLAANPWLVKPTTGGPAPTPAPGLGATGGDRKLLTQAELDALTDKDLLDDNKYKLYLESKAALRK